MKILFSTQNLEIQICQFKNSTILRPTKCNSKQQ